MNSKSTISIADLFCGAGGTSTGAIKAAHGLGLRPVVTAVNHWPVAIETHSANHPGARHLCTAIDATNPRELFAEGELDLLVASPECTGHSNALGDRPVNDQSRATAWCVLRWADALRPPMILIENVPEFKNWAPLGSNNRPLRSRRGEVFESWLTALRSLGYKVDHRVLCAADHGDPTTRRRLFIQAVRGRRKIVWPHATHAPVGTPTLFSQSQWRSARSVINASVKGKSIFGRSRPLSQKTLARIREGAEKFWPEPFVVALRGTSDEQIANSAGSINLPIPTVAGGNHIYVAEPLIVTMENGGSVRSANQPLPTITTARGGAMGVAEPYLVQTNHAGDRRAMSIHDPLPTVCGNRGEVALIEPMLLPQHGGGVVRPISDPMPTVATSGAIALIEPFIVKYNGTGGALSVDNPLDAVTTKDRFGLVRPKIIVNGEQCELDILFRMLAPGELAGAQGFPKTYQFAGTKTQIVKQIGNAVPCNLAAALVAAMVSQDADVTWLHKVVEDAA